MVFRARGAPTGSFALADRDGLGAKNPASSSICKIISSKAFLLFSVKSSLTQRGALPKASTRFG